MNYYRKYIDSFHCKGPIFCATEKGTLLWYIYTFVVVMYCKNNAKFYNFKYRNFCNDDIVLSFGFIYYCNLHWGIFYYISLSSIIPIETISPNTNQPWSYTSLSHSQTFSTANKIWSLLKEKIFEDFVFQFRLIS